MEREVDGGGNAFEGAAERANSRPFWSLVIDCAICRCESKFQIFEALCFKKFSNFLDLRLRQGSFSAAL